MYLISYGTRPELIKLFPLINIFKENNIDHKTIFTGQHEDLIKEFEKPVFYKSTNYYDDLCKSIIYQQLSGKVAKIIYHRFLNLFPNIVPNFKKTLDLKFEELKKIGLSKQKITIQIGTINIQVILTKEQN